VEERPRYDEKLARILRESAAIIARKGFHQASIRDIASATGVSLSGLYYYFSSKEELLFLIQDHCFGTILQRLEEQLEGVVSPREQLERLVRNHLVFFSANMAEMKVLSHEADALTGEYLGRVRARKRRYLSITQSVLDGLSSQRDGESRISALCLFGMMNWIYTWYRPERDPGVEELADRMVHLFLQGFLSSADPCRPVGLSEGAGGAEGAPSIWRDL